MRSYLQINYDNMGIVSRSVRLYNREQAIVCAVDALLEIDDATEMTITETVTGRLTARIMNEEKMFAKIVTL